MTSLAIVLAIGTGIIIAATLARVIRLLRDIAHSLNSLKLLLGAIANQTEPVTEYVEGISANVSGIDAEVARLIEEKISTGKHTQGKENNPWVT